MMRWRQRLSYLAAPTVAVGVVLGATICLSPAGVARNGSDARIELQQEYLAAADERARQTGASSKERISVQRHAEPATTLYDSRFIEPFGVVCRGPWDERPALWGAELARVSEEYAEPLCLRRDYVYGMGWSGEVDVPSYSGRGHLRPEVIRAVLRKKQARIRDCYERALDEHPGLTGSLIVSFEIDRRGGVTNLREVLSELPGEALALCVLRNFAELRFPKPKGGAVTVRYPIRFPPS